MTVMGEKLTLEIVVTAAVIFLGLAIGLSWFLSLGGVR